MDSLLGDIAAAASRNGASCVTFISDLTAAVPPNHMEEGDLKEGMTGAF